MPHQRGTDVHGSALIEGANHPNGPAARPCTTYQGLLVTPPDERYPVRLDRTVTTCTDLQIHPVVPGESGSESR